MFWFVSELLSCSKYKTEVCEFLDPQAKCGDDCPRYEYCNVTNTDPTKPSYCYALWRNTSEGIKIQKQGCWISGNEECHNRTACVEERPNPDLMYCCCESNYCNQKPKYIPSAATPSPPRMYNAPIYVNRVHSKVWQILHSNFRNYAFYASMFYADISKSVLYV